MARDVTLSFVVQYMFAVSSSGNNGSVTFPPPVMNDVIPKAEAEPDPSPGSLKCDSS